MGWDGPSNRQRKRSNARGRSHSQLRTSTMSERVDLRSGSALRVWRVEHRELGGTARMGWMASQDARLQQWGAKWPMRCRQLAGRSLLSALPLPFPSLPFPAANRQPTYQPALPYGAGTCLLLPPPSLWPLSLAIRRCLSRSALAGWLTRHGVCLGA